MKKHLLKSVFLTLCVLIVSVIGMVANAQTDDISVFVNGQQVTFDVQPQTINDRTMVPIRAIFEKMGASVDWDEATRTAICTKGDTTVRMTIDSTTMYINNSPVQMDVTPVVIDGRTLAPARYVAEAYGANVQWSDEKRNVVICTDGIYAYADYPDIPDLGKCYNIPTYQTEYKDGFMVYTYVYSDQKNDDYYSDIYDNSAAVLGGYKEASQGIDDDGILTIAYTKPSQDTPSYFIFTSMSANGDMIFVVTIPDKKEESKEKMYAVDGRTIEVLAEEVEAYKNVGWYSSPDDFPKVVLYATDGRTIDVLPNEVDAYLNVGWYRTAEDATPVTLYSTDGRTISVANAEVPSYLAVGWFLTKPVAPKQSSGSATSGYAGKVYRTPSGTKYHFSATCGGKNGYEVTLEQAKASGLTPCKKCAQ